LFYLLLYCFLFFVKLAPEIVREGMTGSSREVRTGVNLQVKQQQQIAASKAASKGSSRAGSKAASKATQAKQQVKQ
jgi:hypothetical protein